MDPIIPGSEEEGDNRKRGGIDEEGDNHRERGGLLQEDDKGPRRRPGGPKRPPAVDDRKVGPDGKPMDPIIPGSEEEGDNRERGGIDEEGDNHRERGGLLQEDDKGPRRRPGGPKRPPAVDDRKVGP